MYPVIWSSRLAQVLAALAVGWLVSIELGTSRAASREASAGGNEGETVVDTTTSRLFDGAAAINLVTGVVASSRLPAGTVRLRWPTFVAGLAALVSAGVLSRAARSHLGRFHRDDLTVHDDQTVVDSGPYRLVRHPLYLATGSALVGIGAVLGNWISIGSALLPITAILRRITVEEAMLVDHLGEDYVRYQDRTGRLIPGVW